MLITIDRILEKPRSHHRLWQDLLLLDFLLERGRLYQLLLPSFFIMHLGRELLLGGHLDRPLFLAFILWRVLLFVINDGQYLLYTSLHS